MHLNGTSQYHISEEMWLIDSTHACSPNSGSWIEAGEATRLDTVGNWYFWSDCRPGSKEYDHWKYQPPGGDVYAYFQYYINLYQSGEFALAMFNTSGVEEWNGMSTGNSMAANLIEVGLETTNTSATSANTDFFVYN